MRIRDAPGHTTTGRGGVPHAAGIRHVPGHTTTGTGAADHRACVPRRIDRNRRRDGGLNPGDAHDTARRTAAGTGPTDDNSPHLDGILNPAPAHDAPGRPAADHHPRPHRPSPRAASTTAQAAAASWMPRPTLL
ncbi:hypothetical protein ACFVP3_05025 [Streptomyces sp. NPDC057806]|uniref:hypothetical protein n=1 Tax=Streptomyces sp. NPDC057806 TaxID=3346255 RepID=UPI00367A4063